MRHASVTLAHRLTKNSQWFARPSKWWQTSIAVAGGGVLYWYLVQSLGGIQLGDSAETIYTSVMMAHGHWSCAFPPVKYDQSPLSGPVYAMVSAVAQWISRVGFHYPFPSTHLLGAHCQTAVAAVANWENGSGVLHLLLSISIVAWLGLCLSAIFVLGATNLRGTRATWLVAFALAVTPPVFMGTQEYFHPQDQLGLALIFLSVGFWLRHKFDLAGVSCALAFMCQQYAVLAAVALFVVTAGRGRYRMAASAILTLSAIALLLRIVSGPRALSSIFLGTGHSHIHHGTWMSELHVGPNLALFIARVLPILCAAAIAGWCGTHHRELMSHPVVILSLVATCLSLRLALEINVFGYYCMATGASLVLRDIVAHKEFRGTYWWLLAVLITFGRFHNHVTPWQWWPMWVWQLTIALSGCLISIYSLRVAIRRAHEESADTVASLVDHF